MGDLIGRATKALDIVGDMFCEMSGDAPQGHYKLMAANAVFSTLRPGDMLPGGLMVVPVEPTNRMIQAAEKAMSEKHRPKQEYMTVKQKHRHRYRAMIAHAAPTQYDETGRRIRVVGEDVLAAAAKGKDGT